MAPSFGFQQPRGLQTPPIPVLCPVFELPENTFAPKVSGYLGRSTPAWDGQGGVACPRGAPWPRLFSRLPCPRPRSHYLVPLHQPAPSSHPPPSTLQKSRASLVTRPLLPALTRK